MKKSIFLAALGLAAGLASSSGQGGVVFTSYPANNGQGAITWFWPSSDPVGAGYTAELYYALGTVSDPVNNGFPYSITSPPAGLTDLGVKANYMTGEGAGYFDFYGGLVTILGYTGGPITFEVVAYQTSEGTYRYAVNRGRSGAFTMNSIALPGYPVPALGDNGWGMPNFFVYQGPEPSTLTLAGLGGLLALVTFQGNRCRRKIAQRKDRPVSPEI